MGRRNDKRGKRNFKNNGGKRIRKIKGKGNNEKRAQIKKLGLERSFREGRREMNLRIGMWRRDGTQRRENRTLLFMHKMHRRNQTKCPDCRDAINKISIKKKTKKTKRTHKFRVDLGVHRLSDKENENTETDFRFNKTPAQ